MSDHITSIVIVGARGRMGKALIREVIASDHHVLLGAVDRSGGPGRGQDAGRIAGSVEVGVLVTDDLEPRRGNVVIDFSLPLATEANVRRCVAAGAPLVLGTTGLTAATRALLDEASREIAIVSDANFSVGVALLTRLAGLAARALGDTWDAELIEIHHKHKRDAPSGTALRLAKTVAKSTGRSLAEVLRTDRGDATRPREDGEIGVAAIRGGDSVGEHTLLFLADGERLELSHRAHDRAIFARGALRAARWVEAQPPGLYNMADVLGLGAL
ncbi:MAG: 4-hydroxy-tetrahydrodipicolinate reductase [Nannocystis sp.]|jgi:4-hydroxy-tetrahydrodipicolinate reductase|nr:4-hydroxy-tetrahydrodipicolinate reductase [Nannocystis sp.]